MDEFIAMLIELFGTDNIVTVKPTALEETIPDMLSKDWKKRLKAEYRQTLIRYQALCSCIRRYEECKEPHNCCLDDLKSQRIIMRQYLDVLVKRSGDEGVDLIG